MYKPLLLCLCFLACRKATTNNTNPVTVKRSECTDVQRSSGQIKICLDAVNDARCPVNVQCVWAGVAQVNLRLQANDQQHSFRMSTLNTLTFGTSDTVVAGHRIQLLNVLPLNGQTNNGPTRVELQVD